MKKNKLISSLFLMIMSLGIFASCSGEQGPVGPQGEQGLQGEKGEPGKDGANGNDGHSPVITIGNNGNWFIDGVDTGVSAKGSDGNQGEQGPQGNPGKDGTSLLNGNGKPANDLGVIGDSYVDLQTLNYYVKSNGGWDKKGNIKGTAGVGVSSVTFNEIGQLVITLTDGSELDPIDIPQKEEHVHEFSKWFVVKEETMYAQGVESRFCLDCNYTESHFYEEIIDGLTTKQLHREHDVRIGNTLKADTGDLGNNTKRMILNDYFSIKEFKEITINEKYQLCILAYDENKTYLGNNNNGKGLWYDAGKTFVTNSIFTWSDKDYSKATYFRVAIRAKDEHALTEEDFFLSEIRLHKPYTYSGEPISIDKISTTNTLKYEQVYALSSGMQDGEVCGDYIFTFTGSGTCRVYSKSTGASITSFTLDKNSLSSPHSNSICFGTEKYDQEDEFPLLYSNIYNNKDKNGNYLPGVCNVYRIQRNENTFSSTLVQQIKLGFISNNELWPDSSSVRPYGNFLVDTDNSKLYCYVMMDNLNVTRYFEFNLPSLSSGQLDDNLGVKVVTLQEKDITKQFDTTYSRYLQGGCYYKGKVYTLEGFSNNVTNCPTMRVIDLQSGKEVSVVNLMELGISNEPELIFVDNGTLYYGTNNGKFYRFIFI